MKEGVREIWSDNLSPLPNNVGPNSNPILLTQPLDVSSPSLPSSNSLTDANSTPSSTTPPSANIFKEDCMLGIDEAGRGPVLGPMVYSACFCPISSEDILKKNGFADSKTLSEKQRDMLFARINEKKDVYGYGISVLSPQHISAAMLRRRKYNLNYLSHDTAMGLIAGAIKRGVRVTSVYVDTVGDAGKYEKKLKEAFPHIPRITVSKKADSLFPIVSAASICAKVTRDKILREWQFKENNLVNATRNFGSGYPGDPTTLTWLDKNFDRVFGYPNVIRFSWATTTKLLEDKGVQVDWEDGEEIRQPPKTYFEGIELRAISDL